MREILFRGKRIDNGEWAEGLYLVTKNIVSEEILHIIVRNPADSCGCEIWNFEVVDPESISQFTGVTDKNGKKIFEGDILLFLGCHYKVLFFADHARFAPTRDAFLANRYGFQPFCAFDMRCAKVIGNIHDNPELMEVEE